MSDASPWGTSQTWESTGSAGAPPNATVPPFPPAEPLDLATAPSTALAPSPYPPPAAGPAPSYPATGSAALPTAPVEAPPPPQAPRPAPSASSAVRETVTCPECGAVQDVLLNRREASDFCHACDFPLFWTPSQVLRERLARDEGESLRRLPGTVGRSTLASIPCPHCAELNTVAAQVCIRCGLSMHPVAPPVVAYVPPPPPPAPAPVEIIPERGVPWWVWAILGFLVVVAVVLGVLAINGTIG
jgi:hypothetical protein